MKPFDIVASREFPVYLLITVATLTIIILPA